MKLTKSFFLSSAVIFLVFGVSAPETLANPSKHTANYAHARTESLENERFSFDVAWVQPIPSGNTEAVNIFAAHTWDEREKFPGGIITIAVDASAADTFVKKYGVGPDVEKRGWYADLDTRRLTGWLRKGQKNRLFVDFTTVGVDADQVPTGHPFAEAIADLIRKLIEKAQEEKS